MHASFARGMVPSSARCSVARWRGPTAAFVGLGSSQATSVHLSSDSGAPRCFPPSPATDVQERSWGLDRDGRVTTRE